MTGCSPVTNLVEMPTQSPSGEWRAVASGVREAILRIERGFASADDLLLLGNNSTGMAALRVRADKVWPQVRCLATIHPELIPPFVEWFREPDRIEPYLHAAFEAVADEDIPAWNKYWGVVATSQKATALADHFLWLLRSRRSDLNTLTRPGRAALRSEAVRCLEDATPEVVPLLYPCDAVECGAILADERLPAKWRAFVLAATLKASKSRMIQREVFAEAKAFLPRASPDILREYIVRAQHVFADHPELWNALLESPLDKGDVLDRLLELDATVANPRWKELLDSLGVFAPDSRVLTRDRLLKLLATVGVEADAWPIWHAAIARLDLRFLKGDFSQASEWTILERARQRATRGPGGDAPFPAALTAKLEAGLTVQRWMTRPTSDDPAASVHAAFAILGCNIPAALRTIFHSAFGAPTVGRDLAKVDRFARVFLALYPVEADPNPAIDAWQTLAATVPQSHRESLLGYFWTRMMPAVPREAHLARPRAKAAHPAATLRAWKLEAFLCGGIIGFVFLLLGALLLIW